ncbi:16S rRNA (adenine(1518)-N(6)/adenine(1519)-N(6))-dimethyltransferase RsmA [Frateuria aurantia]
MNAKPKKHFGQHFLHDRHYVDRIVGAIAPRPQDTVVEIGPGEGAMTFPLLRAAGRLTAIELDSELIPGLQARAADIGPLQVIRSDILKVDLSRLAAELGAERLRIAGNLPYYISSPILFHCVEHAGAIEDMHFMLQKEVVDRMAAEPGSKTYGRLSVMLQLRCQVTPLFIVPPGAFRPPPKVDSAVVRMQPLPLEQLADADPRRLHDIVKAAFAQRRKTLSNTLKGLLDAAAIRSAGIDPGCRAETLSPADFIRLAQV